MAKLSESNSDLSAGSPPPRSPQRHRSHLGRSNSFRGTWGACPSWHACVAMRGRRCINRNHPVAVHRDRMIAMQVQQARAMCSGAASSAPLELEPFAGSAAAAITVMIASDRKAALHAQLLSVLAGESGIEIKGHVRDAGRLANYVEHHLPKVLMLDKALLDGLDAKSLRSIQVQCQQVRVLLLSDRICQGLVADVLRNRFHGYLLATSPPDICLKAIRAVSEGELWLSRSSMAIAIDELL